jgi:hypothetical protein
MEFNQVFPFSDGLKFPTDNLGNIVQNFSEELLKEIFEPRQHIVVCSNGGISHNLIPLTFFNGLKEKYGLNKTYYYNGYYRYNQLYYYSGYNYVGLNIPNIIYQYPSPIFLNKDIVFINAIYKYTGDANDISLPYGMRDIWANMMMPWDNRYKFEWRKFKHKDELYNRYKMNSKWPLIVIFPRSLAHDKSRYTIGEYLPWGTEEVKLFARMLEGKKVNLVVIAKDRSLYERINNIKLIRYFDTTALKFVRAADFILSKSSDWLDVAFSCSNATLITQITKKPLSCDIDGLGLNNKLIEVGDLSPEEAYRILYG